MGLFSRKNRTSSVSSSPVPASTAAFPSSPTISPVPTVPDLPRLSLRVVVDPIPVGAASAGGLFYISVDPEDDVSGIRRAISEKLGDMAMSIFKVSIPWQAQQQARTYTERYEMPVNLIATFLSWNLDYPGDLALSLGPTGWPAATRGGDAPPKIQDWYPVPVSRQNDMISVLVRTFPDAPLDCAPLTIITHFAPPDPARSARPSSSAPVAKTKRALPVVVDISPSSTVNQLKAAVLEKGERSAECLESVVLWRVEMSEEEMIVIGERGGLKGGRMPRPYPPTAPVPVALSDATLPVSHYFPDSHSNGRMVNLSVWINPSAAEKLAHEIPHDKDAPVFTYTPIVRTEVDRASLLDPLFPKSFDTPPLPPLPATIPLAKSSCSRYRARSSTAPAATLSRTGTPQLHAFGSRSRSLGSAKSSSPLAPVQAIPSSQRGLGISERPLLRVDRQRESVSDVSEDFEPVPSLNFSQLSLSIDTPDTHTLNTPITNAVDWLCPDAPDEHGRTTSAFDASLKASSLGPIWHRGSGRISK